jgi:hypothetical protein
MVGHFDASAGGLDFDFSAIDELAAIGGFRFRETTPQSEHDRVIAIGFF